MDLQDFVARARVARLATVDGQGRPHVVPVCFAVHGDCLYIALDEKPKRVAPERMRRVRNLLANPWVQVLVDRYDDDWSRLVYVQLRGLASLLPAGAVEHALALRLLRAKYQQYRSMALDERPMIKVEINKTVAWESGGEPDAEVR